MLPVADGGDGTVAAALTAGYTKIIVDAVGPTGQPVQAPYALDGRARRGRAGRGGRAGSASRRSARSR